MAFKLIVKNSKIVLKSVANYIINATGIKDLLTGDSSIDNNGKINWTLQHYADTAANFTSNNPTLLVGQMGIETDDLLTVPKFKIGDGANDWNTLPYFSSSSPQSLQSVTDIGATTTNLIEVGGLDNTAKLITLNKGGASSTGSGIQIEESGSILGYIKTAVGSAFDFLHPLNVNYARIALNLLTGNRTYNLPDNSGTIALTSDIPSVAGLAPLASPTFTGTPLAPTPALTINNTQIATMAALRSILNWVTPEMFGAVGDGTTDDSTALQNAINYVGSNSSVGIQLGYNKTYRVGTVLTIVSNVFIKGCGASSKIKTTGNVQFTDITGSNNTFLNIAFEGAVAGGSGGANFALYVNGNAGLTLYRTNNIVDGCTFTNMNTGIYSGLMVGTSSGSKHEGAFSISNCIFTGCATGLNFAARGEYNTVVNCKWNSCTTGISCAGGNNTIIGGHVVDCTTGVSILSGTNNAHGSIVGMKINHNTTNINCTHTLGFTFSACQIFSGNITLTGTGKTRFIGCHIDAISNTLTITNSPVQFSDCEFDGVVGTYTLTGTAPVMISSYSGTAKMATPKVSYSELNTLTANSTFTVPAGMTIESIVYENTTANAVTGGVRIGTTNGGAEVVVAQAIGANAVGQITDANILLRFFSSTAQQILYIQAVTAWNSASVKFYIKLKPLI